MALFQGPGLYLDCSARWARREWLGFTNVVLFSTPTYQEWFRCQADATLSGREWLTLTLSHSGYHRVVHTLRRHHSRPATVQSHDRTPLSCDKSGVHVTRLHSDAVGVVSC